ncbi:MAG: hypothetical protein LUC93_12515 [Planctomycetaceae bacterium]|nr:hypothetical protein [Planctomycetaceae bacterium]
MSEGKQDPRGERVDYSDVTPATGTHPDNKDITKTLANNMPTADMPANGGNQRADPDKVIPGPEAATGIDLIEEDQTKKETRG